MAQLHNPHPGEILKEEFLAEINISQNKLGHTSLMPRRRAALDQIKSGMTQTENSV